jgi:hypothetical protein
MRRFIRPNPSRPGDDRQIGAHPDAQKTILYHAMHSE